MDPIIDNANVTTALQQWELIGGFVLPIITSIIIQTGWNQSRQAMTAFVVSLLYTVVQCFLRGELDNFVDPAMSFLTVLVLTISFYKGFWRPTGISPAIETRTSVG